MIDGQTGFLFEEATASSLALAIERLEGTPIDPARCRAHALDFDVAVFRRRWAELLGELGLGDLLGTDGGSGSA